jgi:phosphoglycerate dehydrogenase-like enzyme
MRRAFAPACDSPVSMNSPAPLRVAVLDDYQHAALTSADWSPVQGRAEVTVFHDHVADEASVVERLLPFQAVCIMRERTPLTRRILERLPNLELIASTAPRNAAIDVAAAEDLGIAVAHTRYISAPTIEHTWALILATARHLPRETASFRDGGWQVCVGEDLEGKTLGIIGLGRVGSGVAKVARAFGMELLAWSEHMTPEKAADAGARFATKDELLAQADFLTIHLVLSDRTRALIAAREFALMKPSAHLINTSRGPIVDEPALIEALVERRIAGAAIDVFDTEPLPPAHPLRALDNVVCTPHLGYVTRREYQLFFEDTVANVAAWLDAR